MSLWSEILKYHSLKYLQEKSVKSHQSKLNLFSSCYDTDRKETQLTPFQRSKSGKKFHQVSILIKGNTEESLLCNCRPQYFKV